MKFVFTQVFDKIVICELKDHSGSIRLSRPSVQITDYSAAPLKQNKTKNL